MPKRAQLRFQRLHDDAIFVSRHTTQVGAVIAKDAQRIVIGRRFDQHNAISPDIQTSNHIHCRRRTGDNHQMVARQVQPFSQLSLSTRYSISAGTPCSAP